MEQSGGSDCIVNKIKLNQSMFTIGSVGEASFYVVVDDRRTFSSLTNRFRPAFERVDLDEFAQWVKGVAKKIHPRYGVFKCTRAALARIQKFVRSCKLAFRAYPQNMKNNADVVLSENCLAETVQTKRRPTRPSFRPTVRHNPHRVSVMSYRR